LILLSALPGELIAQPFAEKQFMDKIQLLGSKEQAGAGGALQIGEVSKVVSIDKLSVVITLLLAFVFLHEKFTPKSLIGCILIGLGTLIMVL